MALNLMPNIIGNQFYKCTNLFFETHNLMVYLKKACTMMILVVRGEKLQKDLNK